MGVRFGFVSPVSRHPHLVTVSLPEGTRVLKIGVLLGDDIGLEVVPEAMKVMKAAAKKTGLDVEWRDLPIGKRGHELHGHTMPPSTVTALEGMDGFLCGPI